ncbi:MAG: phage protein Gp36 family protein [Phenylobacterium sp.]|uniref:phage protein Gp36 family protein n=1 Tax=Phenylobacterium sp. TaxID=1871053 RepID=UPI003919E1C2
MSYAAVAEFVAFVGETEARALAPAAGTYDAAKITEALADAGAELDSYFAARYPTPLEPVPRTVKNAELILAREALDRQGRDHVTSAAARIRSWAKDVAKGLATLGGGEPGEDVPADPAAGGAKFAGPARVFDDRGLAAYLGRRG